MATFSFSAQGRLASIDGKPTGTGPENVAVVSNGVSTLAANPNYEAASVSAPVVAPTLAPA